MAKFVKEHEIKIGEDGLIVLREPTNVEWARFSNDRASVSRGKVKLSGAQARCRLFDKIIVRIENIEDDGGTITLETLDRIPDRVKEKCILERIEVDINEITVENEDLEKNS